MKPISVLLDDDLYAFIETWGPAHDRTLSESIRYGLREFFMEGTEAKKSKKGRKVFVPPTVEEVESYVIEKGYHFDPEIFHANYQSKGWKIGGQPMRDWRAACITWEKRNGNGHSAPVQKVQPKLSEEKPADNSPGIPEVDREVYEARHRELLIERLKEALKASPTPAMTVKIRKQLQELGATP